MIFLSKLLRLYINSSIHVAFAVLAFTCITYLDFDLNLQYHVLSFVFFSTITAYTFVKYIPLLVSPDYKISISLKLIYALALFSIIPVIYFLLYFDIYDILFIIGLITLTLLYVLPFLPRAKNLRDVSGLKIFIIAIVWSGTTVVLPLISSEIALSSFSTEEILYICSRFLIVVALIIPFEIRDLRLDQIYLKTLPQVLGVSRSKILALSFLLLSMFLSSYLMLDTYIYILMHFIIIILVLKANRQNSFYYTSFWVEVVPVLWFLLKYFIG
ncbi:prenyltransferase [Psychroflexus lacisalsi]|uniref:prenyltransferase n=1 Tax=Psychroflexus lacisalsi TaxID=503928 RepID=UPI001CCDC156|nr:prenyltransferase [Psychroflexus lacisalsi]MBZ9620874.1 prenyltransferase [Psychroflexus lacisalsi]